jgi:phosphate transport system permease protein
VDIVTRGACVGAVLLALVPLVSVLAYVIAKGASGLRLRLLTDLPGPVGEAVGGFGNAIAGSALLVGLACAMAIPVGVLGGVYLAEYGNNRLAQAARFCADVMSGVPSIAVGIFVYGIVVLSMRRFSAIAGAIALGILMLPTITRTTEELLRLVPDSLREAGLALGIPKWRVILGVVLRTGAPASRPASCWPWHALRARPRRCSSPHSAAGSGPRASTNPSPRCPSRSSPTRFPPTRSGTPKPGPRRWCSSPW